MDETVKVDQEVQTAQSQNIEKPPSIKALQWIYFLAAIIPTVFVLYFVISDIIYYSGNNFAPSILQGRISSDAFWLAFSLPVPLIYFYIFIRLYFYSKNSLKNALKINLFVIAIILLANIASTIFVFYSAATTSSVDEGGLVIGGLFLLLILLYGVSILFLILGIFGHFILRNNLKRL